MNTRKILQIAIGVPVVLVCLLLLWRSDPVQSTLRPEKYWTGKVMLIEIDVEFLRAKINDCASSAMKSLNGAVAASAERTETVAKLCGSYDEDLKVAVESLLAAKKKLKEVKG